MTAAPDPRALYGVFGHESPTMRDLFERLSAIYVDTDTIPPVANSFRAWAACRPPAGANADTFIRHTCLSLACRMLAYRFLEPFPSERDLWAVINGEYFVGAGLSNFLGEDFFSWPYFRRSMGIGEDPKSMDAARSLMNTLRPLEVSGLSPDLMHSLYRETWDADCEGDSSNPLEQVAAIANNPTLTCIAPSCGGGTTLASAVTAAIALRLATGEHPLDALMGVSGQFLGMTTDPLAAVVAATSFLLSLGDVVKEPHPPILVPIYLADAGRLPKERLEASGERSYVIDSADGIAMPERVAADPLYLDWLLARLPNYQRGAALRLRAQSEDVALQEVLNAWYNYLTSPKARTPIPEPLSPSAADIMVEAARALILAYIHGSGPAPMHLARNAPAPLFAVRREFDLTI